MKATAKAHPIQGLIKYHGLRDPVLRIPFHDSISVCVDALSTVTTVETDEELGGDLIIVNGEKITGNAKDRVETVLRKLKKMADYQGFFRVVSENSLKEGKGLGFSASGFAALGLAASAALKLDLDDASLCETVRMGAGSATRSLVGGFAIWYADKNGRSYAEQIATPKDVDLTMVIIPIHSSFKTDEAHFEVLSSPLFESRLKSISSMVESMRKAIVENDVRSIGRLAEEDTLNLHAITMTGKSRIILWEPETLRIIKEVVKMRAEGIPAWYSIDTGPSVFINTLKDYEDSVVSRMKDLKPSRIIVSRPGGGASLISNNLF